MMCHGYKAFRISTIVDASSVMVLSAGYKAFRISTIVDSYQDSSLYKLAIKPLEFLLL